MTWFAEHLPEFPWKIRNFLVVERLEEKIEDLEFWDFVHVLLLHRRRHCYLPKQYDNLYVESERNHNTRKTDNQKAGELNHLKSNRRGKC